MPTRAHSSEICKHCKINIKTSIGDRNEKHVFFTWPVSKTEKFWYSVHDTNQQKCIGHSIQIQNTLLSVECCNHNINGNIYVHMHSSLSLCDVCVCVCVLLLLVILWNISFLYSSYSKRRNYRITRVKLREWVWNLALQVKSHKQFVSICLVSLVWMMLLHLSTVLYQWTCKLL